MKLDSHLEQKNDPENEKCVAKIIDKVNKLIFQDKFQYEQPKTVKTNKLQINQNQLPSKLDPVFASVNPLLEECYSNCQIIPKLKPYVLTQLSTDRLCKSGLKVLQAFLS